MRWRTKSRHTLWSWLYLATPALASPRGSQPQACYDVNSSGDLGEAVSVEYIELFSPRSLELPEVLQGIGDETLRLPVVLVNGEVLSSGTKLNEGVVARKIAELLHVAS